MTVRLDLGETWRVRFWLGLCAMLLALTTGPAHGRALDVERDFCHALSGAALGDDALSGLRFSCSGAPSGYQQGSLWLRAPLDGTAPRRDLALMVHNSRFDRLAVAFSYADGTTRWQRVRSGRSEEHTSELQSLMRISYAVFCLKKNKQTTHNIKHHNP